jgi:hypothetical protein
MGADELWVESYQGEVIGEVWFGLLAERQDDPVRRHHLEVLTLLERATKELAEPVFDWRALDRGDTATSIASAKALADADAGMTWDQFLELLVSLTTDFLVKYRQLVELTGDERERRIAEAYVAHEEAIATFARRSLELEDGEPLEAILALPHVTAASRS